MKRSIYVSLIVVFLITALLGFAPTDSSDSTILFESADQTAPLPSETVATEAPTEAPTEVPTEPPTEPVPIFDIASGTYVESYSDENTGDYLDYYLFVPDNADFNMPLVVFLHGDGEVRYPETLKDYGPVKCAKQLYGDSYPFIALYPCTRVFSWVDDPIPQTLMGLIEHITDKVQSDPEHIILTGHSRGSSGVWNMLSLYGDYFSAAIPISCGPSTKLDYDMVSTVPVKAAVGTVGEYEIHYGNEMKKTVNKLLQMGADAELIYLWNCGHGDTSTAAYTQEMFDWMLAQGDDNNEEIQ